MYLTVQPGEQLKVTCDFAMRESVVLMPSRGATLGFHDSAENPEAVVCIVVRSSVLVRSMGVDLGNLGTSKVSRLKST